MNQDPLKQKIYLFELFEVEGACQDERLGFLKPKALGFLFGV